MVRTLAIFGAGGLGREVLAMTRAMSEWKVIGFFDDGLKPGSMINGVEVLGDRNALVKWTEPLHIVLAVGRPSIKKEAANFFKKSSSLRYATLIHPKAIILEPDRVQLGEGSILTAGCVITTNISLGNHVLVNLNATIGHDTVIRNYSSIMPGANLAGTVEIGEAVLVGSGANVLSTVKIGDNSIIGAGAVVNHSIEANVTAVGVPARVIKHTS